jgi:hypothetical protein
MAIVLMDGFDCYKDVADMMATPGWSTPFDIDDLAIDKTGGVFGGAALTVPGTLATTAFQRNCQCDNTKTYVVGFWFKASALPPSTSLRMFQLLTYDASRILTLYLTRTGSFNAQDISSTNYNPTVTDVVPVNSYVRVEIKFKPGTSASTGTLEVRVGGTVILTATGVNLYAASGIAMLRLQGIEKSAPYIKVWFDDLVVVDDTGTTNNDYLGDIRIDTLRPNADTPQADFDLSAGTNGYDLIDDALGSPDDASYLESYTPGDKSEFDLSNLIGGSTGIMGVQTRVRAQKTDAGVRSYRAYLKAGTEVANGPTISPGTGWAWHLNGIMEQSPETAAAWTDADIGDLKLGVEVVS